VNFQLFGVETLIQYANQSFVVNPSTNKWTFDLAGWEFLTKTNQLQVAVNLALPGGQLFTHFSKEPLDSQRTLYTFFTSSIGFSVVVANVAEYVSGDVTTLTTISTSIEFTPGSLPIVMFNFPYFGPGTTLHYDPDFSVVLSENAQPSSDCGKFPGWEIAVIVVSVVIPLSMSCILAILLAAWWVYKKRRRPINDTEMVVFDRRDSSGSEDDLGSTSAGRSDADSDVSEEV